MISRDYLSVKVWDLHMETKPIETYTVSCGLIEKTKCLVVISCFLSSGPRVFTIEAVLVVRERLHL
jgi:hypothetical protein